MTFSMKRFWAIMHKELLLIKRDPAVIVIITILPLLIVCIAAYAINAYPKNVPTIIMDYDHTPISTQFINAIKNTGYFAIKQTLYNNHTAQQALKNDRALVILTIPPNFSQDLIHQQQPSILLEDGSMDALSTGRAMVALFGLQQSYMQQISDGPTSYLNQTAPAFKIITHRLYDPNYTTQYFVIPGMIGLVLMLTMLMITTVIAFRDVEGGTIEYLLVSPTRPAEILIAEILTYTLIGCLQLIIGVAIAHFVFHIPFVGSFPLLLLFTIPYLIAELALGLTVATFCHTQFEAIQVLNIFIIVTIVLSGFIFPIFSLPIWAQLISYFIPLTYFLNVIHGLMLRGNTTTLILENLWPLLVYASIMIIIAVNRFERQFRSA